MLDYKMDKRTPKQPLDPLFEIHAAIVIARLGLAWLGSDVKRLEAITLWSKHRAQAFRAFGLNSFTPSEFFGNGSEDRQLRI